MRVRSLAALLAKVRRGNLEWGRRQGHPGGECDCQR